MKTYMFTGQGSQSKGMGKDLFDEFRELTDKVDRILGYSIEELCLEDPRRELNKTEFTQPALYVVNALSYYKKIEDTAERPDYVLGHSLGEFNALLAAECFDFEAGLKMVKKRGELMSEATNGGMAAILNAKKEEIENILRENKLLNVDLVNFNTLSQIVISGSRDEIAKAESLFRYGEVLYYPLNTSGAFHSRFMRPARDKFQTYLKKFKLSDPKIPVIANVTAAPYRSEEILETLSSQIASAVRWSDSIRYLIEIGENAGSAMEFVEIGNGDVLTKIVAKLKTELQSLSLSTKVSEGVQGTSSRPAKNRTVAGEIGGETAAKPMSYTTGDVPDETSDEFRGARDLVNDVVNRIQHDVLSHEKENKKAGPGSDTPDKRENNSGDAARGELSAEQKVAKWNSNYPTGTRVKSTIAEYENLETRTEAVVLFGHRAAVYMKDYNGYFDLDEIIPV